MEVMMKRPSVTEEEASITVSVPEEGDHARKSDQLQSTREEIVEMKQENERLKTVLAKIMNDYRSLQTHLSDVVNKGHAEEPPETAEGDREAEETELVSLSLGTSSWRQVKKEKKSEQVKGDEEDLSLGLGTRSNSSHENSFEDGKEEEIGELWPPSKALKAVRSGEDEVPENLHVKKARVSVRARCDAPTMNDGCQWRKYGQKIAKGNPCPRAYYRCTISPGCPVRKQVQRCADDMSILITTYEGIHNHPLPMAATSMASTTSAAAGMLVSGPSPSPPSIPAAAMVCSGGASGATYPGLNFSFLDDPRQKMTYIPNASISSSPSQATITLDLTSPSPSSQSRFPSNPSQHANPHWNSPLLSYGSQIFNSKPLMGSLSTGSQQPRETFYHPYTQRPAQTQIPLPDTIAAATKAITADPGFQTALAAAITSAVGGKSTQGMADTLLKNFRWGERMSAASNPSSSPGRNGSH